MNLILLDDDILLRSQIKFSLLSYFDNIFEANSIESAIIIIENENIQIALLDLSLINDLDGLEIATKTLEKDIKTIIFTANLDSNITKNLIKDGVFDYLNKPIEMSLLIASVKRAKLFYENEKKLKQENLYSVKSIVDITSGIKKSLVSIEKDLIIKILKENDFNIYKTAKLLGTKRENIYYFINKYDIKRCNIS